MNEGIKLQLGAFDQSHPGWINTDITPHLTIARVPGLARLLAAAGLMKPVRLEQHRAGVFKGMQRLDARKRFPFRDNTVDAIHMSHMLSNLRRSDAERCLRECYRVLKPGGLVRISVLDLDAAVAAYDPTDPDAFNDLMLEVNTSKHPKNRQWWHYNEHSLRKMAQAVGFHDIDRCAFRRGRCPDVERVDSRPQSLIIEALK